MCPLKRVKSITGYGSSPSRHGPAVHRRPNPRSPGSRTKSVHTCQVLRPRRVVRALAIARPSVLPSSRDISSAPGMRDFHGSMAGPCAHLSTLRRDPHGSLRTTRCHRGLLDLRCSRLALLTPCRFYRRTPLRSTPITGASSLLRATPPLRIASVFALVVLPTRRFPLTSTDRFPCSIAKPEPRSCRLSLLSKLA